MKHSTRLGFHPMVVGAQKPPPPWDAAPLKLWSWVEWGCWRRASGKGASERSYRTGRHPSPFFFNELKLTNWRKNLWYMLLKLKFFTFLYALLRTFLITRLVECNVIAKPFAVFVFAGRSSAIFCWSFWRSYKPVAAFWAPLFRKLSRPSAIRLLILEKTTCREVWQRWVHEF